MSRNPYEDLPKRAFWRSGVGSHSPLEIPDVYVPKFSITKEMRISCAGSCFAQHIGAQFKKRGYCFNDLEPPPPILPRDAWHDYGFDLYSARYGNVYSARQLVQMFQRANGEIRPAETCWVNDSGRAYDPFRPAIEPDGFASVDEMQEDQAYHLKCVADILERTDLFVFTLGLTEAWECTADEVVLPTCPGTVAGTFDPGRYRFRNFRFLEILKDMKAFFKIARDANPEMKFLLTVSPVPLTATATSQHVLVASMYSKSVLRAVAGTLSEQFSYVDYFPSYELVASHPMRAMYFEPNLRNVAAAGVSRVMDTFFDSIRDSTASDSSTKGEPVTMDGQADDGRAADLVCEEAILEVFGR